MNRRAIAIITITIFALITGTLGFWGFKILKESKPRDELDIVLSDLKWTTGIDFSKIEETEFKWKAKTEDNIKEITIEGKCFEIRNASNDEQGKVKNFLESEGFQLDFYNVSVGFSSGAIGYKKGNMTCLIEGKTVLNDKGLPEDPVKIDMKISCGLLEVTG